MIVYQATKSEFIEHAFKDDIEEVILRHFRARVGRGVSKSEIQSWKHSLVQMAKVLNHDDIPSDLGVAIEYGIPQTSKRIDVLLSGQDETDRAGLLIVELKQWQTARKTDRDGIVRARFAGGEVDTSHPSYQAWSYAELLRNFNEVVDQEDIPLHPCAYLHNCEDATDLLDPFYSEYLRDAPIFTAGSDERKKLQDFILRHVRRGEQGRLLFRVDNGRIRPSKRLIDALSGMLQGKREFVLVDDQKLVYESILASAIKKGQKEVVIIDGGPGTGKSVVAINLLVELTRRNLLAKYVTKNAAPRDVFQQSLSGSHRRSTIKSLFSGSGEFISTPRDEFDALVVDEAHRLNEKSGLFSNLGTNQIKEIINAARCAIFFLDEDQRVTWKDIGRGGEIEAWARRAGARVSRMKLESQFRCNGSDGYLAWMDDVLEIRETANRILNAEEFDFQIFETPGAVRRKIERLNSAANRARMVAGYCWDWNSKRDPRAMDVVIPEHGFSMQWNLTKDGSLWLFSTANWVHSYDSGA